VSIVILNISKGNVLKSCKLTYLFPSGRRTGRCSRGIGRSGSLEGPRCQTAGTPKSSSSSSSTPSSSSSSSSSCSCSSAPGSSSSSSSSYSATSASSSTRGAPLLRLLLLPALPPKAVPESSTASRVDEPAPLLRLLLPVRRVLREDSPAWVDLPPNRSVSNLIRPLPRPAIAEQSPEIKMSKSISRCH